MRGDEPVDGIGSAFLELTENGTPVQWNELKDEIPAELTCNIAGSVRNCVLVTYVGAHGANAYPVLFDGSTLRIGLAVNTDTPELHAKDLDGDNRLDAYGLQNNYDPSYASGKVQWQTFQRSGDGTAFTSTGCGPLASAAPPPPSALLTGTCSS